MTRRSRPYLAVGAALLILALAAAIAPTPSRAQYLYLDANGDGVHTGADVVSTTGPTTVDVWLVTNADRDGTPATCVSEDGDLTMNSYEFILHARVGTVAYTDFTNHIPLFTTSFGAAQSSTDFYRGLGSSTSMPPGAYRLASVTITKLSGGPSIDVAASTSLSASFKTAFGSQCSGYDFDNTIKLGSEWHDADGLAYGGPAPQPPVVDPIVDMTVAEDAVADQALHATDSDGDAVTFAKVSGPAFMGVTTTDPGAGTATGNIHLAPGFTDAGGYSGTISVSDVWYTENRTFAITVTDTYRPIVLDPIADVSLKTHENVVLPMHAASPDFRRARFTLQNPPEFVGLSWFRSPGNLNGNLFVFPWRQTHVGEWDVTVVAYDDENNNFVFDDAQADSQNVHITVLPNPQPPHLDVGVPQAIQFTLCDIGLYMTDPDEDPIISVEVDRSGIPPADLLVFEQLAPPENAVYHWTPTELGTFTLTFTIEDATHARTSVSRDFVVHSRPPSVTAPRDPLAIPERTMSFTVTVSEPDGEPVQTLTMTPQSSFMQPPPTITIAPDLSQATLTWTPSLAAANRSSPRVYPVSIVASDGDLTVEINVNVRLGYTDLAHLDANGFDLLVSNAGQTGFNPYLGTAGLVYPKGSTTAALFDLGPWVGGNASGSLRLARGGGPPSEYFPGTIENGAQAPWTPRFRMYRIDRGNTTSEDYMSWPTQDGAPVDALGAPALQGDQMTWSVSHDMEPAVHTGTGEFGPATTPLGIEVRQSTFSYAAPGPLAGIAFARFEVTNRSGAAFDSVYATTWVDSDVGVDSDDLAGCDPSLDLGFVYNGTPTDEQYGATPPAFGVALVEGPGVGLDGQPLRMTSFNTYDRNGVPFVFRRPAPMYSWMKGLDFSGTPLHQGGDPSGPETRFRYDGDPAAGTGWLDATLADKRIGVSAGPFHMEAGETRTYVTALIVGQGANHLESVTRVKELVPVARYVAASGYQLLPYVVAPAEVNGAEGALLQLHVSALDLDGDPLTSFEPDLAGLPLGHDATFEVDPGNAGGTLRWTPAYDHAGTWVVRFTASNDRSATFATTLHVVDTNRAPVASAGGPYAGVAGALVAMSAAASADPDGQALTYAWTFGDGASGNGVTIEHTYLAGGTYDVSLSVSDGELGDTDATTATIESSILARAYATGGKTTIRLASGRPTHCLQLEPIGGSFALSDLVPGSLELYSTGTGSTDRIGAVQDKSLPVVDRDENGILELTVCFAKADLRRLFDALSPGQHDVEATLEGALASGARFRAPITLHVTASGSLVAAISPNPLNPRGTLTFRLSQPGHVRVALYDVRGRMVRRLHAGSLGPGYHDFTVENRDDGGAHLASGIYFMRISAPEGESQGRVAILK